MICTGSVDGEGPRTTISDSSLTWLPDLPAIVCSFKFGQKQ